MDSKSVEVERDGIKLGWNLLAILATLGIGLYVASIIAPIQIKQEQQDDRITQVEQRITTNEQTDNNVHDNYHIFLEKQNGIDNEQRRDIDRLSEQLDCHIRRTC